MAICLQKAVCRLKTISPFFLQGRCLTKLPNIDVIDSTCIPLLERSFDVNKIQGISHNDRTISDSLNTRLQLFQTTPYSSDAQAPNNESSARSTGPTAEQLTHVLNVLSETLPNLFSDTLDFSIYSPDLVFENNIHGKRTVGLYPAYTSEAVKLRLYGHLKFAFVKFDIIKITQHEDDATIKLRWRIRGMSSTRVFFGFWRIKLWEAKTGLDQHEVWLDGFSTFYVNSDGLIYRHVADKVIPDDNREPASTIKVPGSKLVLFLGLSSEINPFLG